ncbi:MAG: hypothetical protein AAB739_02125 [Patescibacteria group bacterium]
MNTEKTPPVTLMLQYDSKITALARGIWNRLPPAVQGVVGEDDLWQEGRLGFLNAFGRYDHDLQHISFYLAAARNNMVNYIRRVASRRIDSVKFVDFDCMENVLCAAPCCEDRVFLREIIENANLSCEEMSILEMWLSGEISQDIGTSAGGITAHNAWRIVDRIRKKIILAIGVDVDKFVRVEDVLPDGIHGKIAKTILVALLKRPKEYVSVTQEVRRHLVETGHVETDSSDKKLRNIIYKINVLLRGCGYIIETQYRSRKHDGYECGETKIRLV